jgi:competence ComEA-like helix-hairpin-helix protein
MSCSRRAIGAAVGIAALVILTAFRPGGAASQRSDAPIAELGPIRDPDEFSRVSEAALKRLCTDVCHEADRVFSARRSPREWTQVLADMRQRGAKGSPDELDLVRRYLIWTFGVVAVNTAAAEDLAAVIGLPIEAAEAIVEHRGRHGRFANVTALAAVPGLDRDTIEAQIGALRFD